MSKDITEYKAEMETLKSRMKNIENDLIVAQTKKGELLRELNENFGIAEDMIEATLTKLKADLVTITAELETKINEFKTYLTKVEEKIS